tara:strand:+ start:111361 stop:111996 length:636 start_codon:yes stop_codon:yes gene_type:complete
MHPAKIPAPEAYELLKEGNQRFVAGTSARIHRTHKLVDNQEPFAVVLGCSDSRVPPEILFDHGVGDMFVIRLAGNIVSPMEVGSVEFASIKFGPRLVVVLGHTCCGAVSATVETLIESESNPGLNLVADLSEGMQTIVEHIRPSVNLDAPHETQEQTKSVIYQSIVDNVKNSVRRLRDGSDVMRDLIANHGVMVVGGVYNLETGVVDFFDI